VYIKPNYQWVDNWLEQIIELSNKTMAPSVIENIMDDFCFYVDGNFNQTN
jgi:CCR4-NOT transcriptional regulation complex NOT5 subunit